MTQPDLFSPLIQAENRRREALREYERIVHRFNSRKYEGVLKELRDATTELLRAGG